MWQIWWSFVSLRIFLGRNNSKSFLSPCPHTETFGCSAAVCSYLSPSSLPHVLVRIGLQLPQGFSLIILVPETHTSVGSPCLLWRWELTVHANLLISGFRLTCLLPSTVITKDHNLDTLLWNFRIPWRHDCESFQERKSKSPSKK